MTRSIRGDQPAEVIPGPECGGRYRRDAAAFGARQPGTRAGNVETLLGVVAEARRIRINSAATCAD